MLSDYDLLKFLLPEFLVEHFNILKADIYFEEKSSIPEEFKERLLESKGFLPEIIVDDYPLRGKIVKLHVKRRRWTDKSSGEILQRNWQVVAKGTRMTNEFAVFLKKISRH
ncbi:transposase [Chryseobacterium sp. MEBOG06]|uniref:ISAon1 family transposase N-terminal region protein n=1 Tax=Chryseobacterium sp. MEBOG06 TaxID=2879938 RepID=UPI001F212983|nr:transposase [Chryseobacterium sp. MEBOG06]UKB85759.1 transposase [Chryseobacterium sp. MEBOG06]